MKPKSYKDEKILYYTIKIRRIRSVFGDKYFKKYKDKFWCIDCKDFTGNGLMFCKPTLGELINELQKELYIK